MFKSYTKLGTVYTHPVYVVSLDVLYLMQKWGKKRGIRIPDPVFMANLRNSLYDKLSDYFKDVIFIEENFLQTSMQAHVVKLKEQGLHVVALESAYTQCDSVLEFTRSVNSDNETIGGRNPRRGSREVRVQLESLRGKKIALVDDVIFSGQTIFDLMHELNKHHVTVYEIVAGVAVSKGVKNVHSASFAVKENPHPRPVHVVAEFSNIIDQICERDFYPGVPFSGREAAYPDNYNVPYLLPFAGKHLAEWASIPVHEQIDFSVLCLENAIKFWEEVERLNGKKFKCNEVPRYVKGFPQGSVRFVDCLNLAKNNLT